MGNQVYSDALSQEQGFEEVFEDRGRRRFPDLTRQLVPQFWSNNDVWVVSNFSGRAWDN